METTGQSQFQKSKSIVEVLSGPNRQISKQDSNACNKRSTTSEKKSVAICPAEEKSAGHTEQLLKQQSHET